MDHSDFLDIAGIVGQYVQLTPEGKSHYVGQCPFCSSGEDSLILSLDTQYWHCLSCGENGDRYDFVAKSEKIGRAQAILTVAHHTNSGEPFPHARFKPGEPSAKVVKSGEPERPAAVAPAPPSTALPETKTKAATSPSGTPKESAEKGLLALFLEFRNIIPSYQGAAILDDESRMILSDSEYPLSADLAGIGEILAPILVDARTVFSQSAISDTVSGTLALASENLAILVHKLFPADKSRLLVVRLANPADVPVARRLVASVSAKLA